MSEVPPPIRVLIADDHALVRHGLRRLLREGGFEVAGEAKDGAEAARLTQELEPDVLLLDVAMPETSGFDALRLLSKSASRTRILLLTAGLVRSEVPVALKLGARGVVLKDADAEVLFQAVRAVHDGQLWVRREVIDDLLAGPSVTANGRSAPKGENKFGLTKRELELVGLVASGRSNKEIASLCSLREDTVKHHLSSIFDKTGVSSRLELALFALNNRIA